MPEKVVLGGPSRGEARVAREPQAAGTAIPPKLCNLPPLNSIANQVLALSADEEIQFQRLAAVIEADPAFAAEVLFLANSPLFGFPSKMHVLHHAVTVLGLDRIRALAVTVAMRAYLGQGSALIRQCWRHSCACAIIAEETAKAFGIPGDRAYTVALMHDIGRLGLLKSYPREVAPVLAQEYAEPRDVLQAERGAVNVDHGLAGAWLVKTWAFPSSFSEICEHHHDALDSGDPALLQSVKLACRAANALGYSAVRYQAVASYPDLLAGLPGATRSQPFPGEEELRENVEERLSAFEE